MLNIISQWRNETQDHKETQPHTHWYDCIQKHVTAPTGEYGEIRRLTQFDENLKDFRCFRKKISFSQNVRHRNRQFHPYLDA